VFEELRAFSCLELFFLYWHNVFLQFMIYTGITLRESRGFLQDLAEKHPVFTLGEIAM
jgi:hypothetical protein